MKSSLGVTIPTLAGVLFYVVLAPFLVIQTARTVDGRETGKVGSSPSSSGRITSETVAPDGKYPYIARVEELSDDGKVWLPAGAGYCVILNRDWLLCTPHTFVGFDEELPLENFRIVVGDQYLNRTDEPYEQVVYVEQVIVHSGYDGTLDKFSQLYNYDIAVAKVTPSIKFSNRVTAANLPVSCDEDVQPGTFAWTAGWGFYGNRSGSFNFINNELKEYSSPILSLQECRESLPSNIGKQISDLVLCVKTVNRSGWCFGDRGAPLVVVKNDSYSVVVGLASVRPLYDQPCDNNDQVELYTRVAKYRGWIHRRISNCGNNAVYKGT